MKSTDNRPMKNSKCGWPGWAKRSTTAEAWCESGCGVVQGKECCEASCCGPSATLACLPFDLKTRHLVVVSDTPDARRQLSHNDDGDDGSHIALEVGDEVTVGCEHGYVSPANLEYLNGLDVLKCTSAETGPATTLTCVPPVVKVSTVNSGSQPPAGGDGLGSGSSHVGVGLLTLAGFCAAGFATVIRKRKHMELGLQVGLLMQSDSSDSSGSSSRRGSWLGSLSASWDGGMPQLAFGGAAAPEVKQEMEMGMAAGSMTQEMGKDMMAGSIQEEAMKSLGTASCSLVIPGEFPPAPVVESAEGQSDPATHLYGDHIWIPESPSSDEATDVSADGGFDTPWEVEASEFSTIEPFRYAGAHLSFCAQCRALPYSPINH
jgi:hypothetical protein